MSPSRSDALRALLVERLYTGVAGMTVGAWARVLVSHRFAIDRPYWPRAAFMTGTSTITSLLSWPERAIYRAATRTEIKAPLFILGHWRCGTTHLHNLLALDPQFAFPTAFEVFNPHTFLTTERYSNLLAFMTPKTRIVDQMPLSYEIPLEDEFATCVATFRSPYMSWVFPRHADHYDRYLTFEGVPGHEVEEWKAALTLFFRKLTWKYGRPLVLKSPPHTCRIGLLMQMFQDARFVHIYRNPYVVFQSSKRLHDFMYRSTRLQHSNDQPVEERIIRIFHAMYDRFFAERDLIPEGRFHEMSFEALERDGVGQIRLLYERLGIDGFEGVQPRLEQYVNSVAGYRKNHYEDMAPATRVRIARAWERNFDEWRYAM